MTSVLSSLGRCAKQGFTLIELMVVVVILATLMGLGSIAVVKTIRGAEATKRTSFARVVNAAIAAYKNETGEYPIPEGLNTGRENNIVVGTVTNSNDVKQSNVEVMMMLLGRDAGGKRDTAKRAYIDDTSMLYVCTGKRVAKLDDALAKGGISSNAMIGFPITMTSTSVSRYKSMSKARAFAPIKIEFDFDLDDFKVSVAGDGSFKEVVKIN
jgi:prepilin-type N-terminal cleavage/methylation domain-containing protein